ncbi:MAG: ATP-binding protein [Exilispira sp.]|jgi:magnesium chelatase family protein|nr:ATP-binding protein [Exilispira sp.]
MVLIRTLYIEEGISHIVEIECDSAPGIPGIVFSGRAGKIIEESSIRVRQAIRNAYDISFTNKILINLIPSDIKKNTNLFDLPLAIAIIAAIHKISLKIEDILILGELSLSGQTKVNHSVIPHILRAKSFGFTSCLIPNEKIPLNLSIPISINKVKSLTDSWDLLINNLQNKNKIKNTIEKEKINENKNFYITKTTFKDSLISNNFLDRDVEYDFKDYKGGLLLKRALLISASGFHSLYLLGPSGTGKTLLSIMFKDILPPLLKKEQYELIDLYSQYNIPFDVNQSTRPYRNPHHSSTIISMIGGGTPLSIGEVSLAHHGVLVLDEINLFNKKVLESLREPFEEQKVTISRSKYKVTLPSSFILFLISNLCPCGNYGSLKRVCTCTEDQRNLFLSHISNALKDRIDITMTCSDESIKDNNDIDTKSMRNLVIKAFEKQFFRFFDSDIVFNGKIYKTEIKKYIHLDSQLENYLFEIMRKIGQSFRKVEKVIKIARTIADIEDHKEITKEDIIESLFFVTGFKY